MKRPEFIARQSRCPSGLLGRIIGRIMSAETGWANSEAIRLLSLHPTDHVLEVGFGHGRTLHDVSALVPDGFVAGIDLSADMFRMATRRNRQSIATGRMELRQGDSARLPYADRRFDKVYSVHTLYFWPNAAGQIREIARVTKPEGRFVLGFHPAGSAHSEDFPATVYRFYSTEEVSELLAQAGFQSTIDSRPGGVSFAVGERRSK